MNNKPVTYNPGQTVPEIYGGVPTFLGLPKINSKEDIANSDVVVFGVPWEGICTYNGFSGCELSPKTIRAASVRYCGFMPEYGMDVFDHISGGDYGDIAVQNGNYEFTFGNIRQRIGDVLDYGKIPIILGGDHCISYPLISEYAARNPHRVGVIHFDAHFDNVETFGDEKYARCSPLHRLYEDENLDSSKIVHFGIRGPRNHHTGLDAAGKYGATVMTAYEIKMKGIQKAIQEAIAIASSGTDCIYITICSDVLDVANNPAGPPDPCGLSSFEMAVALYECGKAGAGALDFVEIYPPQDPNNVSSHVAVWLTLHMLAGVAERRKK